MELGYRKIGDYFVPNIELSSNNKRVNLGKYGRMREYYLKEHKHGLFDYLVMTETIISHLESIDKEAKEYEDLLIKQMAEKENVNEKLKETDQLEWVQKMNNIKNSAQEIVINELIYD
ncbi:MAG: TnpV protein [Clostridia bacterium]|nr:TnpV protein [Clostridia bacterium]